MMNVPIPGRLSTPTAAAGTARRQSRRWFYVSVALLAAVALGSVLLAVGEPWNLAPDLRGSIVKSGAVVASLLVLAVPAFAYFRYERASAGRAWHEPGWRPSTIGMVSLIVAIAAGVGWHGLRLAILIAREWTKTFG